MKNSIYSYTLEELESILVSNGFKKFNATQVFEWIYKKHLDSFDEMSNISKELIKFLNDNYVVNSFKVKTYTESDDTKKYLLELSDGNLIECVLMRHDYGNSLCVSTQVGCNMSCAFCESGRLKKVRNLETCEIVNQVMTVTKDINKPLDNIVVMGIGEPFDNYDNLMKFINILNTPKGLNMGTRKITVSTSGIVPKIREFSKENGQVNLAISLHAPNDTIRNFLMPISKKYHMDELIDAIDEYIKNTNRRVTIEYILIDGINDMDRCAYELASLLKGKLVYVNLIPYNETSNFTFKRSKKFQIDKFYDILKRENINVTVRREMGKGIKGACGQLRAENSNKKGE